MSSHRTRSESNLPTLQPRISIDSLPRELLRLILEFTDTPSWHGRLFARQLLRTSLVCKRWGAESQALLWREVRVEGEGQAERLVRCPVLGKLVTHTLGLHGWYHSPILPVDIDSPPKTNIASMKGLQTLRISGHPREAADGCVLFSPNLSSEYTLSPSAVQFSLPPSVTGLKCLSLCGLSCKWDEISIATKFPFAFEELCLLTSSNSAYRLPSSTLPR